MTTLHKQLSEIRELRFEELDLVGGGDQEGPSIVMTVTPTYSYTSHTAPDGTVHQSYNQDDGFGDTVNADI